MSHFNIVWTQRIIEAVEWVEYYRKRLETAETEVGVLKTRIAELERVKVLPAEPAPKKPRGRPRKVINEAASTNG
jgi:hypothetical protein